MFEVIISNIKTGRVWRKVFETRSEADLHIDRFLAGGSPRPRSSRNYRMEVFHRPAPVVKSIVRAAEEVAA